MRLSHANSTVTSFAGIDGDIQLVVRSRGLIILDAQGAERGTDGVLRHNHGVVRLTYDAARELADFIDHMGEPTDPRQTALWSPATFIEPARPPARNIRRRRAPRKMLTNPPADVQLAVSAVITACRNWLATEVPISVSAPPLTPTSPGPGLSEAAACGNLVLDNQSGTRGCNGFARRHYALANLSPNEVHRLRDQLSEVIIVAESADARQPGLL